MEKTRPADRDRSDECVRQWPLTGEVHRQTLKQLTGSGTKIFDWC